MPAASLLERELQIQGQTTGLFKFAQNFLVLEIGQAAS
jgi:hypothetical protein